MKLSEALALRADANKRIAELSERMVQSAKTQEGTDPAEDATALLAQADELATTLQKLIADINKTNLATKLTDGRTLTEAIAERDILLVRISMYRRLADAGLIKQTVQTRSEVRFVPLVDVPKLRRQTDDLSRDHRELDALIQAANWATELLEN